MNLKRLFLILSVVFSMILLASSCTKVSSRDPNEVVIKDKSDNASTANGNEVAITDSDVKTENTPVSTAQESFQQPKRLLADKSEIQTLVDGYGNKTETRYFSGNTRVRSVTLRSASDGNREVTVYSVTGEAKIVPELADTALTASGEEIANAAKFSQTTRPSGPLFVKKRQNQSAPLQPLPSSAFMRPVAPQPVQPAETVEPPTGATTEVSSNQPDPTPED